MFRRLAHFLRRLPWLLIIPYWVFRFFRHKYSLGAVGIIFNAQGQILLVEHVFHPKTPWGLPGGWTDRNENPAMTVKRELREELELDVTIGAVILVDVPFSNHIDIAYLCHADDFSVGKLSFELLSYGWFYPHELPKMMKFHYQAIQEAVQLRGTPNYETTHPA